MPRYENLPGAKKLRKEVAKSSQRAVARLLGCFQQSIGAWASGDSRPNAANRITIEKVLGWPPSDWLTPEEIASTARLTKGAA